jgi:hypothetical protein
MRQSQRIGLLLVHGVGDQGRFEHLQNVAEQIIGTLVATHGLDAVDVIMPGVSGAPLSIMIREGNGKTDQLDIHEMWWRDLGQRQTTWAILRFWWWAASLAGTRGYFAGPPEGYDNPSNSLGAPRKIVWRERFKLFFTITYCFILLAPINLVISFTHFLPGVRRIQFVHSVFTHLSSVQMYQEKLTSQRGTLVDYDHPRRVSIQRRFAEILVTMAEIGYDRWYIAGHSLGSVIALKGLMYNDRAFAKMLNFNRWHHAAFQRFKGVDHRSCGSLRDEPRTPSWLLPEDAVKTEDIFLRLRGLITYGSPLEMFANVWPAIVHVKKRVSVPREFEWINIFDPVDVVASPLSSFAFQDESGQTIRPTNVSCKASSLITSAHVKYWSARRPLREEGLLATVLDWILSGSEFPSDITKFKWYANIKGRGRFAIFGILFAIKFLVATILNTVFFTIGYFVPLNGFDPGEIFETDMGKVFTFLDRLKPVGYIHLDVGRIVIVICITTAILVCLALLRATIEKITSPLPDAEEVPSSNAVRVDSSVLSGRVPSGSSASGQVDV